MEWLSKVTVLYLEIIKYELLNPNVMTDLAEATKETVISRVVISTSVTGWREFQDSQVSYLGDLQ